MEQIRRIDRKTRSRALVIFAAFAVFACVIVGRLFYLQVLKYDYYQSQVANELMYGTEINPARGKIYDSLGNLLATNVTTYLVFISPQDVIDGCKDTTNSDGDPVAAARYDWVSQDESEVRQGILMDQLISYGLADILDGDYDDILELTKKAGSRYAVVKRGVDAETAELVRAFISEYKLTSQIYLRATASRHYPYGTLASHVIGFTNSDGVGIYGVESTYNNMMEGTSGRYVKAQDAHNNDMPSNYESYVPAEDGYNIITTIDTYIQYELERQLKAAFEDSAAGNRVTGIVMNPKTGGILAMATYPNFNLNSPYKLDEYFNTELEGLDPDTGEYTSKYYEMLYKMWNNKAVTDTYEPGSTFKIMTAAMAIEENAVRTDELFTCVGSLKIEGWSKPIHCHKKTGHGTVTFAVGLQQSCNPVLMMTGMKLGQKQFYKYFEYFGYNKKAGVDLPAETATIYSPYSEFSNVSLAVYSFGQTFRTTPIQQLTAISAVANGGNLVTPHVLGKVTDNDGNTIFDYGTEVKRQILSQETCDTILSILEEGVSGDGAAKNAYVKGYKIAAKTGTSEKKDKYDENGNTPYRIGSCVAIAPSDDPELAVIFIVDEPMNGAVYGSVVAAPYVANFLSSVLPYLGIEPQYTDEELATIETSVSNYVGAEIDAAINDLSYRGITYEVIGEGSIVTAQTPEAGSSIMKKNGVIRLYTGDAVPEKTATVPNLIGLSGEAANRLVVNSGLNISVTGASNGSTATVIAQSPAAGLPVAPGTLVTITLRHLDVTDE